MSSNSLINKDYITDLNNACLLNFTEIWMFQSAIIRSETWSMQPSQDLTVLSFYLHFKPTSSHTRAPVARYARFNWWKSHSNLVILMTGLPADFEKIIQELCREQIKKKKSGVLQEYFCDTLRLNHSKYVHSWNPEWSTCTRTFNASIQLLVPYTELKALLLSGRCRVTH